MHCDFWQSKHWNFDFINNSYLSVCFGMKNLVVQTKKKCVFDKSKLYFSTANSSVNCWVVSSWDVSSKFMVIVNCLLLKCAFVRIFIVIIQMAVTGAVFSWVSNITVFKSVLIFLVHIWFKTWLFTIYKFHILFAVVLGQVLLTDYKNIEAFNFMSVVRL